MDINNLINYSLRPTQKILFEEIIKRLINHDDVTLVAGTGIGKTVLAGHIAAHYLRLFNPTLDARRNKNVWRCTLNCQQVFFVVHRDTLVDQTIERFREVFLSRYFHGKEVKEFNLWNAITVIKGNRPYDHIKPIVVASLPSLANRMEQFSKLGMMRPGLIFFDEAHTTSFSPQGKRVIRELNYKKRIGLTATPFRMKKNEFFCQMWTQAVVAPGVADLQKSGELTKVRYFTYDSPELAAADQSVKWEDQLARSEKFISKDHINFVIDKWVENKCDRMQTLVFASNIKHGIHCKEVFEERGYNAVLLCSDKDYSSNKRQIIDDFKKCKFNVFISVDMLDVGFDAPNAQCILMLRRTESLSKLWQIIGRIMRVHKGKLLSWFIDFSGNLKHHGRFAIPEGIRLTEKIVLKPEDVSNSIGYSPFKFCLEDKFGTGCGAFNHAAATKCIDCGKEFERRANDSIEALKGDVVRFMLPDLVKGEQEAIEFYQSIRKTRWVRHSDPNSAYFDYINEKNDGEKLHDKYKLPCPYTERAEHKKWSMGTITGDPNNYRAAKRFFNQLVARSLNQENPDKYIDLNFYLEVDDKIYERLIKELEKEEFKELQETLKKELEVQLLS